MPCRFDVSVTGVAAAKAVTDVYPVARGKAVDDPGGHRKRLAKQRQADTKPEVALRKELFRLGLRYRIGVRLPLEGVRRTADIVFPRRRVAVFVDGCFWHGCPLHGTRSKNNSAQWTRKISENRRRDQDTNDRLLSVGWQPIRVWEHEGAIEAAYAIRALLHSPK